MGSRLLAITSTLALLSSACTQLEPLSEPTTETIEFESVDLPGRLWDPFLPALEEGQPVTVSGQLTIPPTDTPVPAVIFAHGCGGVGGAGSWIKELTAEGIATLVVDSFGTRGIGEICSGRETINVASPIVDVYRAAETLATNPYIDGSRLALIGFSFGGRTAIWAAFDRFQATYDGQPFLGYIAFYPSTCYIELADEGNVTGGPIRILHGTEDNWTPISQCEAMVGRMAAQGVDAKIHAYEGAQHAFDNQSFAYAVELLAPSALSPRSCSFIEVDGQIIDPDTGSVPGVGSTCVEKGVTYAYDASSHEAARSDLSQLLRRLFAET